MRGLLVDAWFQQKVFLLNAAVNDANGGSGRVGRQDVEPCLGCLEVASNLLRCFDVVRLGYFENVGIVENQVLEPFTRDPSAGA